MTEQLKQAAQQALEALKNARHGRVLEGKSIDDAIYPLTRALTTSQPAQAGEVDGSIAAALSDIVAVWDQHAPAEYMTAQHMQAKRALAGQQPVSPDMHGWCAYVGGMVAHWVTSEPDAHARLGDERFEAAIAGIIKRRLWAMPKPTHPAPGVPEGFDVQALTATGGGHKYPLIVVRDKSSQLGEDVYQDEHPVIYSLLSAWLAAAQAKGGQ